MRVSPGELYKWQSGLVIYRSVFPDGDIRRQGCNLTVDGLIAESFRTSPGEVLVVGDNPNPPPMPVRSSLQKVRNIQPSAVPEGRAAVWARKIDAVTQHAETKEKELKAAQDHVRKLAAEANAISEDVDRLKRDREAEASSLQEYQDGAAAQFASAPVDGSANEKGPANGAANEGGGTPGWKGEQDLEKYFAQSKGSTSTKSSEEFFDAKDTSDSAVGRARQKTRLKGVGKLLLGSTGRKRDSTGKRDSSGKRDSTDKRDSTGSDGFVRRIDSTLLLEEGSGTLAASARNRSSLVKLDDGTVKRTSQLKVDDSYSSVRRFDSTVEVDPNNPIGKPSKKTERSDSTLSAAGLRKRSSLIGSRKDGKKDWKKNRNSVKIDKEFDSSESALVANAPEGFDVDEWDPAPANAEKAPAPQSTVKSVRKSDDGSSDAEVAELTANLICNEKEAEKADDKLDGSDADVTKLRAENDALLAKYAKQKKRFRHYVISLKAKHSAEVKEKKKEADAELKERMDALTTAQQSESDSLRLMRDDSENAALQEELKSIQGKCLALARDSKAAIMDYETELEKRNSKIDALRLKLEVYKKHTTVEGDQLVELEKTIRSENEATMVALQEEVSLLKSDMESRDKQISFLSQELEEAKRQGVLKEEKLIKQEKSFRSAGGSSTKAAQAELAMVKSELASRNNKIDSLFHELDAVKKQSALKEEKRVEREKSIRRESEATMTALQSDLTTAAEELDKLREEAKATENVDITESELIELRNDLSNMSSTAEEALTRADEAEKKLLELVIQSEMKCFDLQKEAENQKEKNITLESKVGELEKTAAEAEERITTLDAEVTKEQSIVVALEEEVSAYSTDAANNVAIARRLHAVIDDRTAEKDEIAHKAWEMTQKLRRADTTIEDLSGTVEDLESDVKDMQTALEALTEEKERLVAETTTLQAAVKEENEENSSLKAKLAMAEKSENESQTNAFEKLVEESKQELSKVQEEKAELEKQIKAYESAEKDVEDTKRQLSEAQTLNAELQEKVKSYASVEEHSEETERQLALAKSANAELQGKMDLYASREKNAEDTKRQLLKARRANVELRKNVSSHAAAEKRAEDTRRKLSEAEASNAELQEMVDSLQSSGKENEEMRLELLEAKRANEELQKEFDAHVEEAKEAHESNEQLRKKLKSLSSSEKNSEKTKRQLERLEKTNAELQSKVNSYASSENHSEQTKRELARTRSANAKLEKKLEDHVASAEKQAEESNRELLQAQSVNEELRIRLDAQVSSEKIAEETIRDLLQTQNENIKLQKKVESFTSSADQFEEISLESRSMESCSVKTVTENDSKGLGEEIARLKAMLEDQSSKKDRGSSGPLGDEAQQSLVHDLITARIGLAQSQEENARLRKQLNRLDPSKGMTPPRLPPSRNSLSRDRCFLSKAMTAPVPPPGGRASKP